jgi:Ser/Thr protein kinase RdoA (MazF antagonist)
LSPSAPSAAPDDLAEAREALTAYEGFAGAGIVPWAGGLINRTFAVDAGGARHALQRVSPIFSPAIHDNIVAVTRRLRAHGMPTPELLHTRGGAAFVTTAAGGVWRVLTWMPGISVDVVAGPAEARAAAALVARFHAALVGLDHTFEGLRQGVHDTQRHLGHLRDCLGRHEGRPLAREVAVLAAGIFDRAGALPPLPALPDRIGHGDLKISNVLFAGDATLDDPRALCLVDLDTVGPQSFAFEIGDALRSWSNRAGEDSARAELDLAILGAAVDGYREGAGRRLDDDERQALLLGVEWVSLELAARFAADALSESYFGWDPHRFGSRGEHNLVRARGQWSLHEALVAARAERERQGARA